MVSGSEMPSTLESNSKKESDESKKPEKEPYLRLVRLLQTEEASLGSLVVDGLPFCYTLELPWLGNARNISCIPTGSYRWQLITSEKYGRTLRISDVPERDGILIHSGNYTSDTEGCVLVGRCFERLKSQIKLCASRITKDLLLKQLMLKGIGSGTIEVR